MKYKLREICNGITDGSHNPPPGGEISDYPMISSKNISDDCITTDDPRYLTKAQFDVENKRTAIAPGDVLMTIVGTVGRTAVVTEYAPNLTLQRSVAVLHPNREMCSSRYLMYQLRSKRKYFETEAHGVAQKGLYLKQLSDVTIELHETIQQKEIVDTLDSVNSIIRLREAELIRLDELIKARFVELFDLNSCKRETLGACTDFVDYRGHTPELSDEGTIRMVNAKSVGKGFFKYVDEYVTEETYDAWMHRGFAYPGDVLFVTEGHTFGNTCLIPDDMTKFALGQRVITIKGHDEIRNAFLCSYMQTDMFWKDINVYRTGGTAQGIRSKDLVKVEIPIPPVEIQDLFMNFVKQVDKSKAEVQKALEKTQLLFDSLMQEYFG